MLFYSWFTILNRFVFCVVIKKYYLMIDYNLVIIVKFYFFNYVVHIVDLSFFLLLVLFYLRKLVPVNISLKTAPYYSLETSYCVYNLIS